jgi:ubiquinone/menaquinone biosynthesis C-methylase UbiE
VDAFDPARVRDAYDAVADDYAIAFADDLDHLPVDRSILDAAVAGSVGGAPVLDLGCGPGQVAAYLIARGASVIGLDLSPRMLRLATRRAGTGRGAAGLVCADLRALPLAARSVSAAVAFYSLQHLPRHELGTALDEVGRVLAVGGTLVVAAHLGTGEIVTEQLLDHQFEPMGGTFYGEDELRAALADRSFTVEQCRHRDPEPHEHPSSRLYLIARVGHR